MDDCEFDEASAGASETYPKQCSSLRKNEFVILKGKPCKIVEMSTSKTGKHGHAKVHLVGIDIFTGKKLEDICPSTHNMNCPNVKRVEYQIIDDQIGPDNRMTLMDAEGGCREDLDIDDETLKDQINKSLSAGGDTFVSVVKAMGSEKVISTKKVGEKK